MSVFFRTAHSKPSRQRVVAVLCLALSVLFNASALAEVVAHSAHGPDHSMQGMHAMAHGSAAGTDEQAECHGEPDSAAAPAASLHGAEQETQQAEAEAPDCVCAEVCCPSSVQLAEADAVTSLFGGGAELAKRGSGYLSITLDVVLPPPNLS